MSRWRALTQIIFATSLLGLTACAASPEDGALGETEEPLSSGGSPAGSLTVPASVPTLSPTLAPTSVPTLVPTIIPTTVPTLSPTVFPVPLELAPLSLVSVWYIDLASGDIVNVPKINGYFTWPSPYDIAPLHVHFVWAPQGNLSSAEIPKMAGMNDYGLELRADDQTLVRQANGVGDFYTSIFPAGSFGCPADKTCLGTSVEGLKMFELSGTWTMKIAFWPLAGGPPADKKFVTAYVQPNAEHRSFFTDEISPIFKHERCSTCHSLGSKTLLVAQHKGILAASQVSETVTPRGTQLRCGSGCHTSIASSVPGETFHETEWMVPKFDMGIDWTGKNASQICATVTSKLTTEAALEEHFFEDARIAWAVHSGVLPNGKVTPKAPPGNFADFRVLLSAWIRGGRPCP